MRRLVLLFIFIFIASLNVSGQNSASISSQLKETRSLIYYSPDSAQTLLKELISVIPKDSLTQLATAKNYLGQAYFYKGDYVHAITELSDGITILDGHEAYQLEKAGLYKTLGAVYGTQGNYLESLIQFFEARKIYSNSNSIDDLNSILNNIGITYIQLGDFEGALNIFERLDTLQIDSPRLKAAIPVNLASIYYELGDYQNASIQIDRVLDNFDNEDSRLAGIFYLIGNIRYSEGDYDAAEKAYKKALNFYTDQNNELAQIKPLVGLCNILITKNQITQAESLAKKALRFADKFEGLKEKVLAYELQLHLAELRNDDSKAVEYYMILHLYSDSLSYSIANEKIGKMIAEYEYSEREQNLILAQQQQQIESDAKLARQRIISRAAIIIGILAIVIILMMLKNGSDRKKANQQLEARNKIIEDKAEKLDEANKIKNRLFSIISHDLRGPLSSLQGVLTLIEKNAASEEDLHELLPLLSENFNNTSMMLTNLLNWSRSQMEGFKVDKEEFDLAKVFKAKHALLQHKIEEKELSFDYPNEPLPVYADKNMISLVVQNLVSNSIKFSSSGGVIKIDTKLQGDFVQVSVCDRGMGIPEDVLPILFDNQFYSSKGTKGEQGTGLGLILCRDFVEKNGGKIHVESTVGKGTKIHFTVPLAP